MAQVAVVGSLNVDLVVRAPRLPRAGETIIGRELQTFPGGKGANQAVAAARLGARVAMIGRVGDDASGRLLLDNLTAENVDVTGIGVDAEASSGSAMITLGEDGQNSIVVAPGANMRLSPEQVAHGWQALGHVDAVILSLEIPLPCVVEAARLARAEGAVVVLNPAPAQPLPIDLHPLTTVLVPNETEAGLLAGLAVDTVSQAEGAARVLQARGIDNVVITLGTRGALLLAGDAPAQHVAAHAVKAVDATGAGDAFVAALAVCLAEGASLAEACRMANAAGALAVTRLGAQPSMPTRAEVDDLLRGHQGHRPVGLIG